MPIWAQVLIGGAVGLLIGLVVGFIVGFLEGVDSCNKAYGAETLAEAEKEEGRKENIID